METLFATALGMMPRKSWGKGMKEREGKEGNGKGKEGGVSGFREVVE